MNIIDTQQLKDGAEAVVADVPGVGRVCFVIPTIPDGAPDDVREGIARRRLVYLADNHQCPCGAKWVLPNRRQRRAGRRTAVNIVHEPGCPASDARLDAAILRWKRCGR